MRVQGFVCWPGAALDAAAHALCLAVAILVGEFRPAFGLLLALLLVASSVFQPRVGPLLRHLLVRGRSYNLVVRRGEGPRRVVVFAFVDAPRRLQRLVTPLLSIAWTLTGVAVVALLLRWGGLEAGWLQALGRSVVALLVLLALVLGAIERASVLPAEGDALRRLVALAEVQVPEGIELVLVACGAGFPWLDGLAALRAQNRFEDAEWWPLGRREAATEWLSERKLRMIEPGAALSLLGPEYDAPDVLVADERAGGNAQRDGDDAGG